jgi:hypothetical protein
MCWVKAERSRLSSGDALQLSAPIAGDTTSRGSNGIWQAGVKREYSGLEAPHAN